MNAHTFFKASAVVVLMAVASVASAGRVTNQAVTINDATRSAVGNLVDARDSTDNKQRIGCWSNPWGASGCMATNAEGTTRTCVIHDAIMVEQVRAIASTSQIWFQWDAEGTCSAMSLYHGSDLRPGSSELNASSYNNGSIVGN